MAPALGPALPSDAECLVRCGRRGPGSEGATQARGKSVRTPTQRTRQVAATGGPAPRSKRRRRARKTRSRGDRFAGSHQRHTLQDHISESRARREATRTPAARALGPLPGPAHGESSSTRMVQSKCTAAPLFLFFENITATSSKRRRLMRLPLGCPGPRHPRRSSRSISGGTERTCEINALCAEAALVCPAAAPDHGPDAVRLGGLSNWSSTAPLWRVLLRRNGQQPLSPSEDLFFRAVHALLRFVPTVAGRCRRGSASASRISIRMDVV